MPALALVAAACSSGSTAGKAVPAARTSTAAPGTTAPIPLTGLPTTTAAPSIVIPTFDLPDIPDLDLPLATDVPLPVGFPVPPDGVVTESFQLDERTNTGYIQVPSLQAAFDWYVAELPRFGCVVELADPDPPDRDGSIIRFSGCGFSAGRLLFSYDSVGFNLTAA